MTRKLAVAVRLVSYAVVSATELQPPTAAAFTRCARLTEQRIDAEIARPRDFLWVDTLPPDRRNEIVKGLKQGGVTIERLQTREGTKEIEVPDGLIHHWVGTVFVPRITVKDAVALMQDYDRHSKYFAPAIARSKTLEHHGDRFRVALRFHVKKVITVTMDT